MVLRLASALISGRTYKRWSGGLEGEPTVEVPHQSIQVGVVVTLSRVIIVVLGSQAPHEIAVISGHHLLHLLQNRSSTRIGAG